MTEAGYASESQDKDLGIILETLERRGVGLHKYRPSFLKRRIALRMRTRGTVSYNEYAALLSSDPAERVALNHSFSVNVTEFFRDTQFFTSMQEKVIPSIIAQKRSVGGNTEFQEIRIWCAGCATGEEPYSIAIIASESQKAVPQEISFRIFATDVNPAAIEYARAGTYDAASLRNLSKELVAKYFQAETIGNEKIQFYKVSEHLRHLVSFDEADILKVTPPSKLDMIFCRNVLIYFDKAAREKMLSKFFDALSPGGYLVVGQSEALIGKVPVSLFEPIYPKERIYRKLGVDRQTGKTDGL
ncbi:MAG: protein-glutamate O-methyltransferase CheR [Nitrososphaera sp.]|nr:protein-glutamate O-methyltransferase CheR [Nitrososphaera sp.]